MAGQARDVAVILLAAGNSTRMNSSRAKVLHDLAGRPMLDFPLRAAEACGAARIVVVIGRDAEQVRETFQGRAQFALQAEPRGTGHAVLEARSLLQGFDGDFLILYGDTPLLRAETLRRIIERKHSRGADLVLLSAQLPLPGRVVRDAAGRVERIVEVTDAAPDELALEEGNTGVYLVDGDLLWKALAQVEDRNQQGELYLTDVVSYAVREGRRVDAILLEDPEESLGVNTRAELAQAAAALRRRTAERLMAEGVTLVDPAHTYLDVDVEIGRDSLIEPGCVIKGRTRLGARVHVKAHCTIEDSVVGDDVQIGPQAHLRPNCRLGPGVRVGNFVEVKNSVLGAGVKADHLAYIGDADVGAGASFGCGAIVVNYDWKAKHRTTVGERAFIGCNANLIAPVELAADCFVAAGTTVTQDVPAEALAVARARQRNVEGWASGRGARTAKAGSSETPKTSKKKAAKRGRKAAPKRSSKKRRD